MWCKLQKATLSLHATICCHADALKYLLRGARLYFTGTLTACKITHWHGMWASNMLSMPTEGGCIRHELQCLAWFSAR